MVPVRSCIACEIEYTDDEGEAAREHVIDLWKKFIDEAS